MLRPIVHGPFLKGVIASTDPLTGPKGSVPRASNLLMTQRGALSDCDGSAIINAFGGVPVAGRGRFAADILFTPIGAAPYYLALAPNASQHLGAPRNLLVASTGVGTLPANTYFYVVTTLDGAGGESTASNEVSAVVGANGSVQLTWNTVPNAYGYNIYRSNTSNTEKLLSGSTVPVLQPSPIAAATSFSDDGTDAVVTGSFPIDSATVVKRGIALQLSVSYVSTPPTFSSGTFVTISGNSNANLNGTYTAASAGFGGITFFPVSVPPGWALGETGTGGNVVAPVGTAPPTEDTTGQVVLYKMPSAPTIPISYSDADIVARFPMSIFALNVPPSGSGGAPVGNAPSTPSGGIPGLTSLLPQMTQFTNRVVIALGNGFSPQIYWDDFNTTVNRAPFGFITGISVDAFGVVTVTTSTPLSITDPTSTFVPVGTNVNLRTIPNALFNGAFVVTSVDVGAGTFTLVNPAAIGQSPSSGGFFVSATTPLINTFVPAYPTWAASSSYASGSVVVPTAPNGFYFKANQGGISGGSEPTWPLTVGAVVNDNGVLWENAGLASLSVPPPPGAGHICVYAGSLWAWNTYPTNTATGLDGPCSLRMSDVDNPFSWNPVNQAFLDKDDGSEGMGIATFTISAEGIPPEGSLVAFKNYAGYQIVGVFGSSNFAIQRIRSDMGCTAPRTLKFVPGFGLIRYAHLGVANFDGVRDQVISEEIRPYLFATNDYANADIIVADQSWIALSYADLTANPPMYALGIPIGNSGGALTRLICHDLVLKAWAIVDTPFAFSTVYQARSATATPITILGGFSDGLLQRWQSGDTLWLTGGASPEPPTPVVWAMELSSEAGRTPDQKMQFRRITVRGISNGAISLTVTPIVNGRLGQPQSYPIASSNDFEVFAGVFTNGWRFGGILSGNGHIEIDRAVFQLVDKAIGVPQVIS